VSLDEVQTRVRDRVLVITLNRPEVRNAVNATLARGVAEALERLDQDPDLSVGVITGAGRGFCSGMDLAAFGAGESPRVPGRGFGGMANRAADKPLIAAVEGFAVAGGFEMALACDLIVAARGSRFGLPEVKRGLTAAGGGALRLPQRIPYHQAMEILLSGDLFTAERAYELGLVNRLSEPGTALDDALELALRIGANAPLSLLAVKRIVRDAPQGTDAERFAWQEPIVAHTAASEDAREGSRAFVEKREPGWKGC
jgi:enoyl-CoA hydratase